MSSATHTATNAVAELAEELADRHNSGVVSIAKLRAALPAWDITDALRELALSPDWESVPESNQKTLTDTQRAGALWIGGQHRHYLQRMR